MFEIDQALEAGKLAMGVVGQVTKVIEQLRASGEARADLRELLNRLEIEAQSLCTLSESEIRDLSREFASSELNVDRPITELLGDLRWYNWRTRAKLRSFRKKFREVEERLAVLADDVSALMLCSGAFAKAKDAFALAREEKLRIFENINDKLTVRELLQALMSQATDLSKRLQSGSAS